MNYRLTLRALGLINDVLAESAARHGLDAADRYRGLLFAAMDAVAEDPRRAGVLMVPGPDRLFAFPARFARQRIPAHRRVGKPRHLVVFRLGRDSVAEVLGVVHDRMLLPKAVADLLRDEDGAD